MEMAANSASLGVLRVRIITSPLTIYFDERMNLELFA
jgi:hypothetical protein